jgi:hypothetical protein
MCNVVFIANHLNVGTKVHFSQDGASYYETFPTNIHLSALHSNCLTSFYIQFCVELLQSGSSSSDRYQSSSRPSSSSVKKSNSVLNGGSVTSSVLGKFLKIAKSKSDVQGRPKSRASTYNGYDVEEDFRISPSVLHRGPVEKMVHKSNSRKDVSRSHSWIYGSVKLPSDLPFGYGYSIGGGDHSPSGSENSNSEGSPTSGHQTHGMTALSIPRCQMVDYYNPTCDCNFTGDFDFLTAGPSDSSAPPSNNNGPCKACMCEWALSPSSKNSKGRKQGSKESGGNSFANSVRKLTWKSLKQAVKKRPSLDNLKRSNEFRQGGSTGCGTPTPFVSSSPLGAEMFSNSNGIPVVLGSHGDLLEGNPPFFHTPSPQHAFSADDLQPSYFFPDKKNMYASCTDIYRDPPPHVTASVRVRPKPSRQSWHFPNEFGPVPNYQEAEDLYHSEWDLRQCIPYDVWVSTTSHVKPRSKMTSNGKSKTPTPDPSPSRNASLSKSTSVPYLSETASNKSQSSSSKVHSIGLNGKSSSSGMVSSNSSRANDTISVKSVESSKGSTIGKEPYRSPSAASNGVVKRPSILSSDVNAYQLLKAQTRIAKNSSTNSASTTSRTATNKTAHTTKTSSSSSLVKEDDLSDALSSSSDDLSDNVLTSESHMRIAGQRIYMAPNLNGNQSVSTASSSMSKSISCTSSSTTVTLKSGTMNENQSKTNGGKKGKQLSLKHSPDIDEWSEDEDKGVKKHVSMNRDIRGPPNKGNKSGSSMNGENMRSGQQSKSGRSTPNGIHGLNNTNYSNYRENNNGTQSSFRNGLGDSNKSSHHSNAKQDESVYYNGNQTHVNQQQLSINHQQRDTGSLIGNDYAGVEFEEYEFEDRAPSTTVDFHNQNKPSISKPTHTSSSSSEASKSCGYDLATSLGKSTTQIMRNPLANSHGQQQQRMPSYVKKGQSNTTDCGSSSQLYSQSSTSSSGPSTSSLGYGSNSNGSSNNKLNGLRRRKSRNGSNNPGKLLREVIYEEDVEHEPSSLIHESASHADDESKGGYIHETSQISDNSNNREYAVKIIVSHTGGANEYVKPILKNRDRVYETPNLNGSCSVNDKNLRFGSVNNNEIYFDSSVSTTSVSKKKVQFDQSKVIVCGGDSGPDSDDFSTNEEEQLEEKPQHDHRLNETNDYENDHDHNDVDYWKSSSSSRSRSNHESNSPYANHLQSNEESGSVSLKPNSSGKLASTVNHSNLSSNQSEESKHKPKSAFEEEVARKAASFALSRSRKQAEAEAQAQPESHNDDADVAVKNSASAHEECYDGSVNNLMQVSNEVEARLTSTTANNHTNKTTFSKGKGTTKSNATPTRTGVNSKDPVSGSSQGTGLFKRNPEPSQQSRESGGVVDAKSQQVPNISSKMTNSDKSKGRVFSQKPTSKTSHGVTSNVMKAQKTASVRSNVYPNNNQNEGEIINIISTGFAFMLLLLVWV